MEVIVLPTATETAALAADIIETLLRTGAEPVIGLATGSTPQPLYQELTRRHKEAGLSFAHARAFMLDEYVGLPEDHPERYAAVIQREVTDRLDIPPAAVQGPNGAAADPVAECARYEQAIIDAGGIDVQIAGIGSNGHIAFNEPGSALTSLTRPKTLNARTRQDNARFFSSLDEVPRTSSPRGWAPSGAAGTCSCWPAVKARRKPWRTPWRVRSRPSAPRPSSNCTGTQRFCSTNRPPAGCSCASTTTTSGPTGPTGSRSSP